MLLLAAAALIVVSCASAPPQKASQTSPSSEAAMEKPPAGPAKDKPANDTPVEDSLPSGDVEHALEKPADVALGLPPEPQPNPPANVESVQPARSSPAEISPLNPQQPQPSAAKPQARPSQDAPKPGAAPKQQATAQPGAASGAQQLQAGSGLSSQQPQASGAQPSQTGSAQGAANADSQSSAASPYGRLREIYARAGDDLQIGLDGVGFLFLGFPDRSPNGDGMSFKGKDTRDGKTWFSFKALKLGTYDLDFLRQDNTTGTSSKETVRVHVVSDADFATAVAQGQQQTPASAEAAGDPAFAARLAGIGQYGAALDELLKGYREGNPGLNDSIAQLYLRTGAYDAAGKYFTKNLSEQGQYGDSAVLGLAKIAIAQKDQAEFLSLLKRLLDVKDPGLEETLLAAARFEKERQEAGLGIDLATEYLTRYPDGKWRDEADFVLAQLLERDTQFRDLVRARATYKEILIRFPESPFAAAAQERIGYIDRHFFEIR
jgi:tetratricopeptide (TPR) repeat protein